MKTKCKSCGRIYEYNRSKGHTKTRCNSCLVNDRRFALKERMLEHKGKVCTICGYNKCTQALVFHHLDATQKDFNISGAHCRKWETLKKELDKCILVCLNCHAEIHAEMVKRPSCTP